MSQFLGASIVESPKLLAAPRDGSGWWRHNGTGTHSRRVDLQLAMARAWAARRRSRPRLLRLRVPLFVIAVASSGLCSVGNMSGAAALTPLDHRANPAGGGTWSKVEVGTAHSNRLASVSCASASFCVTVSENGFTYRFDGSSWTPGPNIGGQEGASINSVSCSSPSFCVAVGPKGYVYGYDGTRWAAGQNVGHVMTSVWCTPYSTACAAVSQDGYFYGTGADSGYLSYGRDPIEGVTAISCGPIGERPAWPCEEAARHGRVFGAFSGNHEAATLGSHNLTAISCPGSCFAVDDAGNFYAYSYEKTKWLPGQSVDAARRPFLTSISCPSTTGTTIPRIWCVAVSENGYAYLHNGHGWSSHRLGAGRASDLSAVACPSYLAGDSIFCVIVSRKGSIFTYQVTPKSGKGSSRVDRVSLSHVARGKTAD
jgi:hypothetical protein